jgi:hypothetical protein
MVESWVSWPCKRIYVHITALYLPQEQVAAHCRLDSGSVLLLEHLKLMFVLRISNEVVWKIVLIILNLRGHDRRVIETVLPVACRSECLLVRSESRGRADTAPHTKV